MIITIITEQINNVNSLVMLTIHVNKHGGDLVEDVIKLSIMMRPQICHQYHQPINHHKHSADNKNDNSISLAIVNYIYAI